MNENIEIIDQPIEKSGLHLVKVQYADENTRRFGGREYHYYSFDPLQVGVIVTVPAKDGFNLAKVTAIDVPESEIAAFEDKMKIIPAGSVVSSDDMAAPIVVEEEPETYEKTQALMKVEQDAGDMSVQVFQVTEITTPELHEEAEKWLSFIRMQLQDAEKARVADVKKPNDYVRWINSKYKQSTELLRKMEQHCLKIIGAYRAKEAEKQKHEQQKVDDAAQRQFDRQVAKGETPSVPVPISKKVEGIAKTADTGEAKNMWGTEWDFEIVNPDQVPREYCVPDEKRIRQFAKLHQSKAVMPGVRFFEKPTVQVRRSKVNKPE